MKGQLRNMFPGGNTPDGFYSYYNYILPQRKAKKIFCIKGGPGVGKSTLMKAVGRHFHEKGESVDFLWCSSDPNSLDGILLKDRATLLVDGTAPHIVDPKNPGAVDEIVNLGTFWNEESIAGRRDEIISCNENIAQSFDFAYGYLKIAKAQYDFMAKLLGVMIPPEKVRAYRQQIGIKTGDFSHYGTKRKAFAGAITPAGIQSTLDSLAGKMDKIILIEPPLGFRTEALLAPISDEIIESGYDVEEFYCPMDPGKKLEHIIVPDAGLAIVSCNAYHAFSLETADQHVTRIKIDWQHQADDLYETLYQRLAEDSRENIARAVKLLERAKALHDELEGYYIPNMDFDKIEEVKHKIIGKIEETVLY